MEIWKEFKNNIAVALLFLTIGFAAGLGTYKYLSDFFNTEVVLKDSYIYKSDIEESYVHLNKYEALLNDFDSQIKEKAAIEARNKELQMSLSEISTAVCKTFELDVSNITKRQQKVEAEIKDKSRYRGISSEDRSNQKIVIELRKYSEQLNQQLIQVREKLSKCIR